MPIVNTFELDENIFKDKELNIKKFDKPSKEWAKFILNKRDRNYKFPNSKECNVDNKYDLVIYKELTDQYSFHTEKALKYLKGV